MSKRVSSPHPRVRLSAATPAPADPRTIVQQINGKPYTESMKGKNNNG